VKSRIGLLGGTFNPIHFGHIEIAKVALNLLKLNKLIFIPAGNPWQKEDFISFEHRLKMLKLATKSMENVEVSELEKDEVNPSYTYQTLQELHKIYPESEFIFLIGSDAIKSFGTWKEPNLIKTLARIYVVPRQNDPIVDWHFDRLQFSPTPISSSQIREKIKNGEGIQDLVPAEVIEYIKANQLYKS
jgi:nicotinate-nucleotide adenylyltransferase